MKIKRPQSYAEELANCSSHGLGLFAALASAPILIVMTARNGGVANTVGAVVFAICMILMYGSSTLYHALPQGARKQLARKLDHAAIYLLIAGTYTPFTLGVLKGVWGWALLGAIWSLALTGLLLMLFNRLGKAWLSNAIYLLMGWLVVIAAAPMIERMPVQGLLWLLAGGLAYTGGVVFYALDGRWKFSHFIWHLFVMAGTACHFWAVLQYAA